MGVLAQLWAKLAPPEPLTWSLSPYPATAAVPVPAHAKTVPDGVSADIAVIETWRLYGGPWDHYGAMYRRQPAVRTVVDFLSRNIAQLKPKVYQRRSNEDRLELPRHGLAQRLAHPNEQTTPFRFWRETVADMALHDRAYWQKIRDRNRLVRALVRIPVSSLNVEANQLGRRVYRLWNGTELDRDDLVIFPGYHPEGTEDGVSPLETLRRVLQEEWEAQNHRQQYWRNAARQGGVIERPLEAPEWDDIARKRFREDWQSTMAGGFNAGKTGILEEGMRWNAAAFSPKDSEYIEGRKLTFKEVARAYAPSLVGLMADDEPKANVEAYHRQLYQDVLAPITRNLEDEIELQLLPEYEGEGGRDLIYVEFNLNEKLRGSFEEQARSLTTAIGVPYLAINEARAMLNRPRIVDPDFDVPVKPLNVMYGGQPAVTVPTATPATPPGTLAARSPQRALGTGRKAAAVPRGVLVRRTRAARQHTRALQEFFAIQEKSVLSALGAKKDRPRWWDADRWNAMLEDKLYPIANRLVRQTGELAAGQLAGTYDHGRTATFVAERSRIAAEAINQTTMEALAEAFEEDGMEGARAVFDEARSSRAERLGLGTATGLIAYARTEAARQSEQADGRRRMKVWVVTSANSRHPELNGETVPLYEAFSNGAQYPGDPTAGADEVAGCRCLLQLTTE